MKSIGIAFKKHEIIMVALRYGLSDISLEDYRILPFLDSPEEGREGMIQHNLDLFIKEHRSARDNVFLVLPRDDVLVQFLQLPAAAADDLAATLGYEIDRHTPFSAEDVCFGYHVVKGPQEDGLISVLLVTAKKESIDYYTTLFKNVGVRLRGIETTVTSLLNLLTQLHAPPDLPIDVQWIKKYPALVSLYMKHCSGLFPRITRVLQQEDAADDRRAVDIMVEYLGSECYDVIIPEGTDLCLSRVLHIPDSAPERFAFQDLYDRVLRLLINLPLQKHEPDAIRLILSGRDMESDFLQSAPEDIRENFEVLRRLPVTTASHIGESVHSLSPLLAAAAGAALKGLKQMHIDLNMVPPAQRLRKKRSKRKIIAAAAAALLVVGSGALIARSIWQLNIRHAVLTGQLDELKKEVRSIEGLQSEAENIDAFAEAIESIRTEDKSKLVLLEEVTDLMPSDSWLTQFDYDADEKEIKLSGYSDSASQLIPILEESSYFENVRFTSPITTDRRTGKERFRLEMTISTKGEKNETDAS